MMVQDRVASTINVRKAKRRKPQDKTLRSMFSEEKAERTG